MGKNPYTFGYDGGCASSRMLDVLVPNELLVIGVFLDHCPADSNRHILSRSEYVLHLFHRKIIGNGRKWQMPINLSSWLGVYYLVLGPDHALHAEH